MRVDTVVAEGSGENSSVSVQGVSMAVVKALTESMEPCSPAAQTPNPILTLTTFTVSYHISTRSLKVLHCSYTQLPWPPSHRISYIIITSSQKWLQWLHENIFIVLHLLIYLLKTVNINWNQLTTIMGCKSFETALKIWHFKFKPRKKQCFGLRVILQPCYNGVSFLIL